MKPLSQLPDDITRANQELTRFLREDLPVIAGVEAIKLITRNFEAEGFVDAGAVDKWPARKLPGITSPIMTQRAQLRNAARARSTNGRVEVGIDLGKFPQAQILQEGGTIPVSPAMRRFFWAMCYKHRKPNAKTQNGPAAFWLPAIVPKKLVYLQHNQRFSSNGRDKRGRQVSPPRISRIPWGYLHCQILSEFSDGHVAASTNYVLADGVILYNWLCFVFLITLWTAGLLFG